MKCPSCGFENEGSSKFCQSCGGNMEEVSGAGPSNQGTTPPPPTSKPRSGSTPGNVNIDIGGWLSKGFSEVFADIGNYILLGLVVGIVSGITFGILAGPLF